MQLFYAAENDLVALYKYALNYGGTGRFEHFFN
jgi:hypothetical protein